MALVSEMRPNIGSQQLQPIRVFIVDDSSMIRERLVTLLDELIGVEIVGQAHTAAAAIADIQRLKPDAVILDIRLPDDNGLTVLKNIKRGEVTPVVIVLTNHAYPAYRRQCRQAGAEYFLDKSAEFDQISGLLMGL